MDGSRLARLHQILLMENGHASRLEGIAMDISLRFEVGEVHVHG